MDVQTKAMIEKLEARITELENKFEDLTENHLNNMLKQMIRDKDIINDNFADIGRKINELEGLE